MQNLVSNDPDYRLWTLLNRVRDAIYKAREYELVLSFINQRNSV